MADLVSACSKASQIRHELPRSPSKLVEGLNAIREYLAAPGEPVPLRDLDDLKQSIDLLVDEVVRKYPDEEDRRIEEGSHVHFKIVELDATLSALRRHVVESENYKDFLRYLKRIECVLPSADYDFKALFQLIDEDTPTKRIYDCLRECLDKFSSGKYKDAIAQGVDSNQLLAENLFEYSRKASLYAATTDSLHQLRRPSGMPGAKRAAGASNGSLCGCWR